MQIRLKRKAFNESIPPIMTSSSETWLLSNIQVEKLITAQGQMERIIAEVTLKDKKSTNWIRKQTGVTDIITNKKENKHR